MSNQPQQNTEKVKCNLQLRIR